MVTGRITDLFSIDRAPQEPRVPRKPSPTDTVMLNPAASDIHSAPNDVSLRDMFEQLQFGTFPVPLVMDSSGEIWFAYPTIHGVSRTTYPKLQKVTPGE